MIVLLQFLVLRRIAGHRRTRVMLVMCAIWALSYAALGATGTHPWADYREQTLGGWTMMGRFDSRRTPARSASCAATSPASTTSRSA